MPSRAIIPSWHGRNVKSHANRTKRATRHSTRKSTDDKSYRSAKYSGQTRKKAVKPRKGIFRFLDLPYDIKRAIYDLCLISSSDIVVSIDLSNGGNGIKGFERHRGANYDDLVDLTSDHSGLAFARQSYGDFHPYFNANILLTSKALHAEAMPVLYSQNTFAFYEESGLDAFVIFQQRLTEISRISLRRLHLKFPQIERIRTFAKDGREDSRETLSHIRDGWLVDVISGLKGLRSLHLRLEQDLVARDIAVLERLNASLGANGRIFLKTGFNTPHKVMYRRRVRLAGDVVEMVRQWGWEIVGEVERTGWGP